MHTQHFFCYDTIESLPWGEYNGYSQACLVVYHGDYTEPSHSSEPTYSYDSKVRRKELCLLASMLDLQGRQGA